MGGTVIETREQVEALSEASSYEGINDLTLGDFVELSPCATPDEIEDVWKKKHGQPCPRVELDPENEEALEIVCMAVNPKTRPLVPRLVDLLGLPRDEERAVLRRVSFALNSEELNPPQTMGDALSEAAQEEM